MIRTLTHVDAIRIGQTIVNELTDEGFRAAVTVCNPDGGVLFHVRMTGVRVFTAKVATLKAEQAAATGRTTRALRDSVEADTLGLGVLGIRESHFIRWAGGVPIWTPDDDIDARVCIGGVGVSNLDELDDERFAREGVRAVGFLAGKEDELLPERPEEHLYAHHVAIGLPSRDLVHRYVRFLEARGAVIVSEDPSVPKAFLRINPWDTILVEVFGLKGETSTHVDFVVSSFGEAVALHEEALCDIGIPGMRFLSLGGKDRTTIELAFSVRD